MIEAIAIAIAVLGAVTAAHPVCPYPCGRCRTEAEKASLARTPAWPTCSTTPPMVDDGVIVGKNGSFMAAWLYQGDDNASSTDEQREMVSFRINQALAGLGNGWMVHVDAVRRPAPNYSDRGPVAFPRSGVGGDG